MPIRKTPFAFFTFIVLFSQVAHKTPHPKFKVIAFYTARNDKAHISFVHEANQWFPKVARDHSFQYDRPPFGITLMKNSFHTIKSNEIQDKLIIDGLLWLGEPSK